MKEITPGLFVGDDSECFDEERSDWAVVHACKEPCHSRAISVQDEAATGEQSALVIERGSHLYLNMLDPERPRISPLLFQTAVQFLRTHVPERKVLIHCNAGDSRAPSIALVYLAGEGKIASDSYDSAEEEFLELYPDFSPGSGVFAYFQNAWSDLVTIGQS